MTEPEFIAAIIATLGGLVLFFAASFWAIFRWFGFDVEPGQAIWEAVEVEGQMVVVERRRSPTFGQILKGE